MRDLESLSNRVLDNLSALKSLTIRNCGKLESLPEEGLPNLTSLEVLVIVSCGRLNCLPMNGLCGLSSLRKLHVACCDKFTSLSEGVRHLTALKDLNLFECPELNSLLESMELDIVDVNTHPPSPIGPLNDLIIPFTVAWGQRWLPSSGEFNTIKFFPAFMSLTLDLIGRYVLPDRSVLPIMYRHLDLSYIMDAHYKACLYAGINTSGINGEVMSGLEYMHLFYHFDLIILV
ncbi:hypothetical protein NC651_036557 [Populus alba x Populus x berolinensis]|nr:hypothetical protein NC651_036557 [Populus alba x Populus x berolinensis]